MKRVDRLRDLSDDHHTGLILAVRCKRAGRPDSGSSVETVWANLLEAFDRHLEPHFRIEDELLVPALIALSETRLAERIVEDHRELRRLRAAQEVDRGLLARFGELLEAHIRFEERQVFESTQHRLPSEALDAIAAACASTARDCSIDLEE